MHPKLYVQKKLKTLFVIMVVTFNSCVFSQTITQQDYKDNQIDKDLLFSNRNFVI